MTKLSQDHLETLEANGNPAADVARFFLMVEGEGGTPTEGGVTGEKAKPPAD